jgi:hypothetical protein
MKPTKDQDLEDIIIQLVNEGSVPDEMILPDRYKQPKVDK